MLDMLGQALHAAQSFKFAGLKTSHQRFYSLLKHWQCDSQSALALLRGLSELWFMYTCIYTS